VPVEAVVRVVVELDVPASEGVLVSVESKV